MQYAYKYVREGLFRQACFGDLPTSKVLNIPLPDSLNAESFCGGL